MGSSSRMNAALRAKFTEVSRLLAAIVVADTKTRYDVGVIVAAIKADDLTYGARACEKLAAALDCSPASLYRNAIVAECWSRAEFTALLRRRDARGQPLSWTHWVVLASVDSESELARFVDEALDKSLSARELKALVTARKQDATEGGASTCSTLPALRRILAATDSLTSRWQELVTGIDGGEAQRVD